MSVARLCARRRECGVQKLYDLRGADLTLLCQNASAASTPGLDSQSAIVALRSQANFPHCEGGVLCIMWLSGFFRINLFFDKNKFVWEDGQFASEVGTGNNWGTSHWMKLAMLGVSATYMRRF